MAETAPKGGQVGTMAEECRRRAAGAVRGMVGVGGRSAKSGGGGRSAEGGGGGGAQRAEGDLGSH